MATRLEFPPATGTYRVLVVPVLEPGQAFRDPDLANLTAALRSGLFNDVTAFFTENSFGQLTVEFQVFGHDVVPRTQPLRLPRAISSYWNPAFEPGGFDAVEGGLGAGSSIVLDGTESLRLQVRPRQRPQAELDVSFSALSAESTHGAFPVTINVAASDAPAAGDRPAGNGPGPHRHLHQHPVHSQRSVGRRRPGHHRGLSGPAHPGGHGLTRPSSDRSGLLQPARLQRLRGVGAGQLGTLVLDISVHPDYGGGTARIEVVSVNGLAGLGLGTATGSSFTPSLFADRSRLQTYLRRRLELAQETGGFNAGNRLLSALTVAFSAGTLTLGFRLSAADGGEGSSLVVVSQTGLDKLGFDSRTAVAGVVTAGDHLTVRDADGLLNDMLTLINDALGQEIRRAGSPLPPGTSAASTSCSWARRRPARGTRTPLS
jgi:hypothetical protein